MERQQVRWTVQLSGFIILLPIISGALTAQYLLSTKAGLVQFIDGNVLLDDKPLQISGGPPVQMENGQSLRTKNGRAELLLNPSVYLRLGENSVLRVERNQIRDALMALDQGSALIEAVEGLRGNRIRVRFAAGIAEIKEAGLYRIDAIPGEIRVYGGSAILVTGNKKIAIKNERMLGPGGSEKPAIFDAGAADSLHQWAAKRSFDLFNAGTNRKQANWQPVSLGWVINTKYRMRFYSKVFFERWLQEQKKERVDEAIKSALQSLAQAQNAAGTTASVYALREAAAAIEEAKRAVRESQIPDR